VSAAIAAVGLGFHLSVIVISNQTTRAAARVHVAIACPIALVVRTIVPVGHASSFSVDSGGACDAAAARVWK
jgi:hypothetical protein